MQTAAKRSKSPFLAKLFKLIAGDEMRHHCFYRDALKEPLSADVMAVVQRQYDGVKRNHDQIRTLRNQARASS